MGDDDQPTMFPDDVRLHQKHAAAAVALSTYTHIKAARKKSYAQRPLAERLADLIAEALANAETYGDDPAAILADVAGRLL